MNDEDKTLAMVSEYFGRKIGAGQNVAGLCFLVPAHKFLTQPPPGPPVFTLELKPLKSTYVRGTLSAKGDLPREPT